MGSLVSIFTIIVVLCVFSGISSAMRKQLRDSEAPKPKDLPRLTSLPKSPVSAAGKSDDRPRIYTAGRYPARPSGNSRRRGKKAAGIDSSSGDRESTGRLIDSPVLLEDRENDWLAKQLKEEAKIMRRGDMLDLGASHGKDCDARRIKTYHILHHDSSIDDGEM